jgi:hypothetical protein
MRFDAVISAGVGLVGMEFADPADFGATAPVGPADEAVLAGLAERLGAHGKTERFGVRLIRNPLGLCDDEVLVESCDLANRTLLCSVGARGADTNAVETTWQWRPAPATNGPAVHRYCTMQCSMDSSGAHFITGHTNYPDSIGKNGPAVHRYCINQCTLDSGNNHYTSGHSNFPDS